jgi:eukaryotic-like serine/threonine-protein kinase
VVRIGRPVVSRRAPVWFGKYKLLERIAVGGMAEVFLAVRPGLEGFEKTLAIKRIRPHLSNEEAFVKMFLNEAKLAAQLQHPNIVQIFDLGKISGSYFIAMEYISGRDMSRTIPKAEKVGIPFPIEYALAVGASVLDGLSYAHAKTDDFGAPLHIVHRDITPENIMVGWNGNVKILDFGIAKATIQTDQTRAGEIKGKLAYMSPEQGMGKVLDARSDIFALGVVMYEWITGYKMFTGENEMAILKSIVDGRIYPPSYFREDIPEPVEDILMKALAKDREQRYQTARDMQFDIQEWLQHGAEFSPSPAHLANFMKQIFHDEIELEREALAEAAKERKRRTPPPPPANTGSEEPMAPGAVQPGDAVGRAKTPPDGNKNGKGPALIVVDSMASRTSEPQDAAEHSHDSATSYEDDERNLTITLRGAEFERLRVASERSGVQVEDIVRDLLRSTLKYL